MPSGSHRCVGAALFNDGVWRCDRHIDLRSIAKELDTIGYVSIGLLGHEFNERSALGKGDQHHRYGLTLVLILIV